MPFRYTSKGTKHSCGLRRWLLGKGLPCKLQIEEPEFKSRISTKGVWTWWSTLVIPPHPSPQTREWDTSGALGLDGKPTYPNWLHANGRPCLHKPVGGLPRKFASSAVYRHASHTYAHMRVHTHTPTQRHMCTWTPHTHIHICMQASYIHTHKYTEVYMNMNTTHTCIQVCNTVMCTPGHHTHEQRKHNWMRTSLSMFNSCLCCWLTLLLWNFCFVFYCFQVFKIMLIVLLQRVVKWS